MVNYNVHVVNVLVKLGKFIFSMCANCCYKALEHPSIAHVKSKPLRETIFQVLGLLIKRYRHGISCVVKIVQVKQELIYSYLMYGDQKLST